MKRQSWSQNLRSLSQKTKKRGNNAVTRRFGKYSFQKTTSKILVRAFWNFKLMVLHHRNCRIHATLIPNLVKPLIYVVCTALWYLQRGQTLLKLIFTVQQNILYLKLSQNEDLYLEKKSQKLCDTKVWKWLHKDLSLLCEIHEQQIHCEKIYMLRVLPCNTTNFNYGHICKICYNLEYI